MSLPKLVRHQEHHCNPMGLISPKCKMASSSNITIIINIRVQDPTGDRVLMQSMVMYFFKLENKAVTNKEKPKFYYLGKKKNLGHKGLWQKTERIILKLSPLWAKTGFVIKNGE